MYAWESLKYSLVYHTSVHIAAPELNKTIYNRRFSAFLWPSLLIYVLGLYYPRNLQTFENNRVRGTDKFTIYFFQPKAEKVKQTVSSFCHSKVVGNSMLGCIQR